MFLHTRVDPLMQDCKSEIWLDAKILARTLEHQNLRATTFKVIALHDMTFEKLGVGWNDERSIFFTLVSLNVRFQISRLSLEP